MNKPNSEWETQKTKLKKTHAERVTESVFCLGVSDACTKCNAAYLPGAGDCALRDYNISKIPDCLLYGLGMQKRIPRNKQNA